MPESLYGAHPKKLPVRFKLPSHLDLLRFQHAKVKVGSAVYSVASEQSSSAAVYSYRLSVLPLLCLRYFFVSVICQV